MDYDEMDNAMTNAANKQPGVLRRVGLTGAVIVAACVAAGATFLGYGVDANLPWPVTANTTIVAKYCGGTIQAGNGSTGFFTVTIPAVAGFPTNCVVNITNGDTTTFRGKAIVGLIGSSCSTQNILWPGQTCKIGIVNGAWAVLSRPGRRRPPNNMTIQFYSDWTNGSDTIGATDGMAPGASAFQQSVRCLEVAADQIDFNLYNQTKVVCNMAAATTEPRTPHLAFQGVVGANGTAALTLVGASLAISGAVSNSGACEITVPSTSTYTANEVVSVYSVAGATGCNGAWQVTVTDATHLTLQGTTFGGAYTGGGTVTNGSVITGGGVNGPWAMQCYYGTVIEFQNITFQGTGLDITSNCYVQMQQGVMLSAASGNLAYVHDGAQLHFDFDLGIVSGASGAAFYADQTSLITADNVINLNFLPGLNPTFAEFAFADLQGQVNFTGVTINLNGNAVTGAKCVANSGGLIVSATGNANTYFPGSTPCTQSGGGNIDGVINIGSGNVAGTLPAANLPNPSASTLGGIESLACPASQWINTISTAGVPACAQPSFGDVSGHLSQSQAPNGGTSGQYWQTSGSGTGAWASTRQILTGGGGLVTQAAGITNYIANGVGGIQSNQVIADVAAVGGTLKNLYIVTQNAPGAGQSYTYTLYVGTYGSASLSSTGVTCQVSGASATTCNDTTHTTTITAGQAYAIQLVTSGGAATMTGIKWGVEFDNP